jgi:hypothetical protein
MSRAADGWMNTGAPIADVRSWLDNTVLPPELRRTYEAEYERVTGEITARVLEQNARDAVQWRDDYDSLTAALDALTDEYETAELRAREGYLSADAFDAELVRLDARRAVLEKRSNEPERVADRIERIAEAPLDEMDSLYRRYPALPRPSFSFVPTRGL